MLLAIFALYFILLVCLLQRFKESDNLAINYPYIMLFGCSRSTCILIDLVEVAINSTYTPCSEKAIPRSETVLMILIGLHIGYLYPLIDTLWLR